MRPNFFKNPLQFRQWLEKNHNEEIEIWIGFWKKASGKGGMNYDQALDEALCFGWIDGIVKKYDEISYVQRFTPRRPKSTWSKINVGHIKRLVKEGRMMPSGLASVEAAKADGRWKAATDSPANMKVPKDFLKMLAQDEKAREFFKTLNKTNLFYIAYQLHTAKKEETRIRRMKKIIEKLSNKEKFY